MKDDHAFRWPDEDPAPLGWLAALRGHLRAAARSLPRLWRSGRAPRLRLGQLWRTRPLPLALWMAAGLGPLAWAIHSVDSATSGSLRAITQQELREPASSGADVPQDLPARAAPVSGQEGRSAAEVPRAPAQWGEPLPAFRHVLDAPAAASGAVPSWPSVTSLRPPGRVVLASEYFAQQPGEQPRAVAAAAAIGRDATPGEPSRRVTASAFTGGSVAGQPPPADTTTRPIAARDTSDAAPRALLLSGELPDLVGPTQVLALDDAPRSVAASPRVLTLEQAIEHGLRQNAEVRAARARWDAFRDAERQAQLSARERLTWARATGPVAWLARAGDRDRALTTAAEMVWRAAVSDASSEIAGSYLQTLQARIVLSLADQHDRQLRHLLGLMTSRAVRGEASRAERDRIRIRAAQARARRADAQVVLDASLDHLASLIGETPALLGLSLPAALRAPADARAAWDEARLHNLELAAARSEVTAVAFEAWNAHDRAAALPPSGPTMAHQVEPRGSAQQLQQQIDRELDAAYAALRALDNRQLGLRQELLSRRRAVAAVRSGLLHGSRAPAELLEAYQRLYSSQVEMSSVVLDEALNHVRITRLTGRLGRPGAVRAG